MSGVIEHLTIKMTSLERQNDRMLNILIDLDAKMAAMGDRTLSLREIQEQAGLKSYKAFRNRLKELIRYGLYKDGTWKMQQRDLNRYLSDLKKP